MDVLSLVLYTFERPPPCPVLLGHNRGASLSVLGSQTNWMSFQGCGAQDRPRPDLLSGWVCEQGRTQILIVLKDIPRSHPINKKMTFGM